MINEKRAKKYCSEDISAVENYDLAVNDNTQMWDCHHKLEIQGPFQNSPALLKKCGLYYDVPAWQLIFLTHGEHMRLHKLGERNPMFGKRGEKNPMFGKRGEKNPMFGKRGYWFGKCGEKSYWFGKHHSEKTKEKISAGKIGMKWWNNGIASRQKRECPGEGWVLGRLKRNQK